jgi:translation initiation factor 2 alpha subunit (eIF-2alpha)
MSLYYKDAFPKLDDIVFVSLETITEESNVIVRLLEYNLEGMIQHTEVAKYVTKPNKLFKKGKTYACVVLGVDEKKKHIDLSYRKISDKNREIYDHQYVYIKKFHELETIIDPSFRKTVLEIFDVHKLINTDFEKLYNSLLESPNKFLDFIQESQDSKNSMLELIKTKTKSTNMILEYNFDMLIIEDNAIQKLKDILDIKIHDSIKNSKNTTWSCDIITPPKYKITVTCENYEHGKLLIKKIIEEIKNNSLKVLNNKNNMITHTLMSELNLDSDIKIIKEKTYTLI